MKTYDIVIIGGGPAGLAAAIEAYEQGIRKILVIERENQLGGILKQCIHNGFGIHIFKEELTGPAYAERYIDKLHEYKIDYILDSMVIKINSNKEVHYISLLEGYIVVKSEAIILAMGCRERTRGSISIPGSRPKGVLTAGLAQKYVNIEGYLCGKKIFILGSGDIGLIMARRMTLEGAEVLGVAEINPYSNGLTRNIVQCLYDFNIPLYLSHTVTKIIGRDCLEKIIISKVDRDYQPVKGTEKEFEVDTLLLSVGLIPENELSKQVNINLHSRTKGPIVNEIMETNVKGIFACGNVLHVHDLVDYVSKESVKAARGAVKYLKGKIARSNNYFETAPLEGISYIIPNKVTVENVENNLELLFRTTKIYHNVKIVIKADKTVIKEKKVSYLLPSEMNNIIINKDILKDINFKILSLEVED